LFKNDDKPIDLRLYLNEAIDFDLTNNNIIISSLKMKCRMKMSEEI